MKTASGIELGSIRKVFFPKNLPSLTMEKSQTPLASHCKNFNTLILSCHTWSIPKKCPNWIYKQRKSSTLSLQLCVWSVVGSSLVWPNQTLQFVNGSLNPEQMPWWWDFTSKGRDSSVGRASDFGPQGRGFKSANSHRSDIGRSLWQVPHHTIPWCQIGTSKNWEDGHQVPIWAARLIRSPQGDDSFQGWMSSQLGLKVVRAPPKP